MKSNKYFKHSIIFSGNQEDVENEINQFIVDDSDIISITVTPEKIGYHEIQDCQIPKYVYHICIVYR